MGAYVGAQGNIAAVTTGDLTVTLPTHEAGDIIVATVVGCVPNSTSGGNTLAAPSGWTKASNVVWSSSGVTLGEWALFWKRAASGSETNPTFVRPTGWDTGANDTVFACRIYTIKDVARSGTPYDDLVASVRHTTANQQFSALTVNDVDRLAVHFYVSSDNQTIGAAPSGWSAGVSATDGTGTDSGFQTYFKTTDSSTAAAAPTIAATAQGGYVFFGMSFKPFLVKRSLTGSGAGSSAATRKLTAKRTGTATGTGTSTAPRSVKKARTATGNGTGGSSTTRKVTVARTASASGNGSSNTSGARHLYRTANGSGAGSQSAQWTHSHPRDATSVGTGSSTTTTHVTQFRSAEGDGQSSSSTVDLFISVRSASGSGNGGSSSIWTKKRTRTAVGDSSSTSTAVGVRVVERSASGTGLGSETSSELHCVLRTGDASGVGSSTSTQIHKILRNASGSGSGGATSTRLVVIVRSAAGSAEGVASTSLTLIRVRSAQAVGTSASTAVWRIETPRIIRNATGAGSSFATAIGGKTVYTFFTLHAWSEPSPTGFAEPSGLIYVEPAAIQYSLA